MNKRILPLLLFILGYAAHAQLDSLNFGPQPKGGVSSLALIYYKIDFTREQRVVLQQSDLELIFHVDKEGKAKLEKVNGLNDRVIIDSMKSKDPFLSFIPQSVNGVKESSIFFMKLSFPTYGHRIRPFVPAPMDVENAHVSGRRFDMVIGGVVNTYSGNASNYLNTGGGMKMDMTFAGDKGWGGGMVMNIYGNKLKRPYPVSDPRQQMSAPSTILIGVGVNKFSREKERREYNVQLEFCYVVQTIIPASYPQGRDYVDLSGFSPGISGHYLMQIGRDRRSYWRYGQPAILRNYINLHAGIHPLFYNNKQANGIMFEAGISYRLGMFAVEFY